MNSLYRAIAQLTRTGSGRFHVRFLLQSSYSVPYSSSSSTSTSTSTTTAISSITNKPSEISQQKSAPLPSSPAWPRPREIPFQVKVSNSVNLIGYISEPIQSQTSPDGNHWAATVITQLGHSSHSPLRIAIVFEGDLAHVAARHLKKNDHVHIDGQLTADHPYVIQDHAQLRSSQITKSCGRLQQEGGSLTELQDRPLKDSASMKHDGDSALNFWKDLVDNPKQWWDYRSSKLSGSANPRHPDFKHKDGGQSLWLDRAPGWILSALEKVEFDVKIPRSKQVKQDKGDESWKELVENPDKWWDNRLDKRNVKSPDFKHKETGKGLWLSDSPTWVLSQLPPLKSEQKVAASKKETQLS